MKIKRIVIAVVCFVMLSFGLFTGCTYSKMKGINDNWEPVELSSDIAKAIKIVTVSFERDSAYAYVELTEECESCSLVTGNYEVSFTSAYYDSVSGEIVKGDAKFWFSYYGSELQLSHVSARVDGRSVSGSIMFKRAGGEVVIPGKPDDPDIPDNPDNPDNPVGESKFSAIKAAYKNAGYNVELASDNNLDANSKLLISTLQTQYAALGYEICFIGKDLSNLLGAELYMLISTETESEAREVKQGFESVYKAAQKGRDLIVYIWTLGVPNFSYFEDAVN